MEKLKEVKTYQVEFECGECGQGNMIYDGLTLESNPPKYVHKCSHCQARKDLPYRYPRIIHK
jgi:hypothetical protein